MRILKGLWRAIFGHKTQITLREHEEVPLPCSVCGGRGCFPMIGTGAIPCDSCGGTGYADPRE